MKRTEWLVTLEQELGRVGVPGAAEIVTDYEEHFAAAMAAGKTEEEICAKLGDPKTIAKAHHAENLVTTAAPSANGGTEIKSVWNASWRLLVLTPFTFCMLVGPFFIVSILLFVGWVLAVVFSGVSIGAAVLAAFAMPFLVLNFWGSLTFLFGALSFIGGTVLLVMSMWIATSWLLRLFVSYLRWNVDFVLEK